jgi:integrase
VLEKKKKRRAPTIANAEFHIGSLNAEIGHTLITTWTPRRFEQWVEEFRKGKTRQTYFDYAKYFNLVMRYAYEAKYVTHLVRAENPDPPKQVGRWYAPEELAAMLAQAAGLDTYTQILMGHDAMMRRGEILKLEWARFDLDTGLLELLPEHVKTGSKTGKGRTFYVTEEIRWLMNGLYRQRASEASQCVFPSPVDPTRPILDNKTAWGSVKRLAGIKGRARFHDLRHSGLSEALLVRKINPLLVSEYAGVGLKTLQQVYLHVRPEHTAEVAVQMSGVNLGWNEGREASASAVSQ